MPYTRLAVCLVLAAASVAVAAADLPRRKSGLWEMKTQMEGMPSQGPMQMCVDQASDNLMRDEGSRQKPDCPVMEVSQGAGGKVILHSVCRMEKTTATTDAVMTGDFNSGYRSDMKIRYNPPMHGMSEMKMVQEARWLGPCKPGQKPGDVMMPGMPGGKMNMQDMQRMMNDPEVQKMMRQQRGAGGY